MVQSRIQPTTHGNKKNIGGGGWGWTKFEKGGQAKQEVFVRQGGQEPSANYVNINKKLN